MGESTLYPQRVNIEDAMGAYIASMDPAVTVYLQALLDVGNSIAALPTIVDQNDPKNTNLSAAKTIHINADKPAGSLLRPPDLIEGSCAKDIASKFAYFFQTHAQATVCKTTPLQAMMFKFIEIQSDPASGKDMNFVTEYYDAPVGPPSQAGAIDQDRLLTGYAPGRRQSASNGQVGSPLATSPKWTSYNAKRNFYSTKFFRMASVIDSSPSKMQEPTLREELRTAPVDFLTSPPKNLIIGSSLGSNPKFFYDF